MSTKKGELELSATCGECKEQVEVNWILDLHLMHACDPGCCCGECYHYYDDGGYDVEVAIECPHCGVQLKKSFMSYY